MSTTASRSVILSRFAWVLLAVLVAVGLRTFVWPAPSPAPTVTPRLALALQSVPPTADLKVWVHFRPRALSGRELREALAAAESDLTPRAANRRAKVMPPGGPLVDVRDLPLSAGTLAECATTGAVLHQRSRWLNAASFRATPAQVLQMGRIPGVRAVDLVNGQRPAAVPTPVGAPVPVPAPDKAAPAVAETVDYGANLAAMQQVNVPALHAMGLTGQGVLVAVLDTGFRLYHEALSGIPVVAAWDFVNNDPEVDFQTGDPTSAVNHGTMTLSTLAGHKPGQLVGPAYGVAVLLGKTEDVAVEVPLEEDNWVAGLEWAEALGADIISSSLGYVDWYLAADLNGNTAVTTIAADLAAARGLIVVNSAGNDRNTTGHLIAPADADSIVTVGAVDATGATAWFSSPGPTADGRLKPDVSARGVACTVASPTNDTGYLTANGTSFSCPITAGVAALMLERVPGLTPLQVLEALRSTASQSTTPDNDQGWGIVDAFAAATWFGPVITHSALADTSDVVGPYPAKTLITDRIGLDGATASVRYRTNGGPWQQLSLQPSGEPDGYAADLPGQAPSTVVEYYFQASSLNGVTSTYPYAGESAPLAFLVTAPSRAPEDRLPAVTHLAAAVPNPFNPQTLIAFELAAGGPTVLRVFDLRGQLVRTLLAADLPAGSHRAWWDGRDQAGRDLASGTYLYRLSQAGEHQQRKMLLVR